jgi:hypothetical protein
VFEVFPQVPEELQIMADDTESIGSDESVRQVPEELQIMTDDTESVGSDESVRREKFRCSTRRRRKI